MSYTYQRGQNYKSRNKDQIDELRKQAIDSNFDYNPNTDAAYQDYARMMRESGQKAMEDTVGKASAMTGGYGNSYASVAGQQVYNDFVSEAASAQGDFYDRALARFANERALANDKIATLESQEASDKAAWEADYLADVNKASISGDTKALAEIYGISEEQYINYENDVLKSSLSVPTQDILDQAASEYMAKGYFESGLTEEDLMNNILTKYVEMGYNPDAIAAHLAQVRNKGEFVTDRVWTYVSGSGKNAIFTDQFGNRFYQDEILNWAEGQGADKDAIKALKNQLKAQY